MHINREKKTSKTSTTAMSCVVIKVKLNAFYILCLYILYKYGNFNDYVQFTWRSGVVSYIIFTGESLILHIYDVHDNKTVLVIVLI